VILEIYCIYFSDIGDSFDFDAIEIVMTTVVRNLNNISTLNKLPPHLTNK